MQKILLLLCFTTTFISFGQFESTLNQIKMYDKSEGLRIQNDLRSYFELESYTIDSLLNIKAQKWAEHLARTEEFKLSTDDLGESIFSVNRNYADQRALNLFKEASLNWLLTKGEEDGSPFLQIISNKATKIGVGIAKSMEAYYIVAKYDSIY